MTKVIQCSKVVPESGCPHTIRGATADDVLRNAQEHAKEHGIIQVTPELIETLKSFIEDE